LGCVCPDQIWLVGWLRGDLGDARLPPRLGLATMLRTTASERLDLPCLPLELGARPQRDRLL
jgi:hypothetical protein